ncbi:MAG: xylosidase [Bacteroides sp.]|nr:xylosidase [Bacteroides sp.]
MCVDKLHYNEDGTIRPVQQTKKRYNSYKGLVMAGYQGWFNAPTDGANRGWYHYTGHNGFKPGSCTIDLWPEVSEYSKLYQTEFTFDDGTPAYTFSSYDPSTVDTHFRWMKEYGIDGAFMQRFVAEIRYESGLHHFNKVLDSAMKSANKHGRAICVMYDLSGMNSGEEQILLNDIKQVTERHALFDRDRNPSYLYHNGKPLVAVWGVGFNDHRRYGLAEAETIVKGLKQLGFSVMLGVPTYWRELKNDTESDPRLHDLIRQCDIIMPWFVGRYDEASYPNFHTLIEDDIAWTKAVGVDYAPLCFPGFSWENMIRHGKGVQIARNKGSFFWKQLTNVIRSGAEMIYIAMFDEIDEGTAIFKCAHRVPTPTEGSVFVPMEEGTPSDLYLRLAGEAGRILRKEKTD